MSSSFQCIYVGFYVKWVERRIAPQIERMMGMTLYGALARREPLRAKLLADGIRRPNFQTQTYATASNLIIRASTKRR